MIRCQDIWHDQNQEKFSRLYDDAPKKVYRFVFLRVNSKEVAQDLTAEAFARCWEKFKKDPGAVQNPRAFLYKNRPKSDWLTITVPRERSRPYRPKRWKIFAGPKIDLEKKAMLASEMNTVRQAMSHLNDDYQNAIIWRYLDDLSIKEVSQLLDRSEEATRVLLHRAMKKFKTYLS